MMMTLMMTMMIKVISRISVTIITMTKGFVLGKYGLKRNPHQSEVCEGHTIPHCTLYTIHTIPHYTLNTIHTIAHYTLYTHTIPHYTLCGIVCLVYRPCHTIQTIYHTIPHCTLYIQTIPH